jgi:hypothetical protein
MLKAPRADAIYNKLMYIGLAWIKANQDNSNLAKAEAFKKSESDNSAAAMSLARVIRDIDSS